MLSFFKEHKTPLSSLLRLLNLSLEISISGSFSSKELRYVSIIASLFFGLNEDFNLNFLLQLSVLSSFQKRHINLIFLPKTSNSCLRLILSTYLIYFVSCLCDKLITFLLTNFPSGLLSFNLALLSSISCGISITNIFR